MAVHGSGMNRSWRLVAVAAVLGCSLLAFSSLSKRSSWAIGETQVPHAHTANLLIQFPSWWWANHLSGKEQRCGEGNSCMRPADVAVMDAIKGKPNKEVFSGMLGEDRGLWENFFYGMANGTYLEMGAVDGVGLSNSRFFANHVGWTGVLIEALPDMMPKLVQNRPESVCINTAVCGKFTTVHYWRQSSAYVSGIREFMDDAYVEKWYPKQPNGSHANIQEILTIPCVPLSYILDCVGIHTFDLWSLDVEGAELQVLQTVDFSRTTFGVIIVELRAGSGRDEKNQAVVDLLTQNGYRVHYKDNQNHIFVHKGFKPSSKKKPAQA